MKIVYYINSLTSGGAERQLVYTAIQAKQKSNEVHIITNYAYNHYNEFIQENEVNIHSLKLEKERKNSLSTILKRIKLLKKLISIIKPDIFHAFLPQPNLWGIYCSWRMKVPVRIASVRSTNKEAMKGLCFYSKLANIIIFNTRQAKEIALQKSCMNRNKAEVINNCIDFSVFSKLSNQNISYRGPYNGVFIGRIAKSKNHINFIKSLLILKKQNLLKKLRLSIIGEIQEKNIYKSISELIAHNKIEDNVNYLGVRKDIPNLLSKSDFLVLPSKSEGMPNVILEAMATRTFVISSAVGNVPDIIKDNKTGILINNTDDKGIAEAIKRYINLTREEKSRIIENAFLFVKQYDKEKIYLELEKLYKRSLYQKK